MEKRRIKIFDSTLRDGAQAQGISFSVEDKLRIVKKLDELGVDYVEAGNPGSNQKDQEFFDKAINMKFKHLRLAAFGSTRRKNCKVEDDQNVLALLNANTEAVVIFGKAWDFHVAEVLKTTNEENAKMISDTISFFKNKKKEVIFDAEHFFDGYKANSDFALEMCGVAAKAGASTITLCDTNGGTLPQELYEITKKVVSFVNNLELEHSCEVGIHCHNDAGVAVANSLMAVDAGATHVQGTFNGFGERCGNANLATIIGDLQLKQNYLCIPPQNMVLLMECSLFIDEVANIQPDIRAPYVGKCSFVHKGGMHIDGVNKNPLTFEHIDPSLVGNERRFLISEQAGRGLILKKIQRIDSTLDKSDEKTIAIIDELKRLESIGYQFEGAEASFQLRTLKLLNRFKPHFNLIYFRVNVNEPYIEKGFSSTAVIKIKVDEKDEIMAAEGDGPVNALDMALRKVISSFYPQIQAMQLTDYKVRVIGDNVDSASKVRVLIESTDGNTVWSTVGVANDIVEASWIALVDAIEYYLYLCETTT